jgi:hypothetical protein
MTSDNQHQVRLLALYQLTIKQRLRIALIPALVLIHPAKIRIALALALLVALALDATRGKGTVDGVVVGNVGFDDAVGDGDGEAFGREGRGGAYCVQSEEYERGQRAVITENYSKNNPKCITMESIAITHQPNNK